MCQSGAICDHHESECPSQESALIEAFNLKAAVELHMGNVSAAQTALQDMPPRAEADLDPVCTCA